MPVVNRARSLRRLVLFSLLTLAGLAGLLADLLVLGPISQPPLSARHPPGTIPNTDVNPYGVNVFLHEEVEEMKKRLTLEMVADAGIGWVKQQFPWAEIEPRPGYFWDDRYDKSSWEKFDQIIDLAGEYGLEVIARVDRPPAWARPEGSDPKAPPIDPHDYADFIYEFVRHYRGRIHYVQIWNEPNLDTEWVEGQPVDAQNYVTMLRLAYERAKEADPNVQVLSAPLAARTTDDPDRVSLSDLTYLEEMYQAGAAPHFDILSANAYGFESPPQAPPDPAQYNFRRAELIREIMEKHGDDNKPVWFNEYGWNTAPADLPREELKWGRVSEEQQAQWTVEGFDYARREWPWAGVICIWYFRQVGEQQYPPTSAEYYFRMVNVDFTPQPVYTAIQKATTSLGTASPGRYEESAAPVRRRGRWQSTYDDDASGGAYAASSEPGSGITLVFLGTDLSLRVRRGPDGGRLLVTVDGVSGRGTSLPRDDFDRAYLDLYSPLEEWVDLPLVEGLERELPPQSHRLELSVDEEKSDKSQGHLCIVDAFEVGYQRSYVACSIIAGFLFVGTCATLTNLILEFGRPAVPEPKPAPINPWTLRLEQLEDTEKEAPSRPPARSANNSAPTQEA